MIGRTRDTSQAYVASSLVTLFKATNIDRLRISLWILAAAKEHDMVRAILVNCELESALKPAVYALC